MPVLDTLLVVVLEEQTVKLLTAPVFVMMFVTILMNAAQMLAAQEVNN